MSALIEELKREPSEIFVTLNEVKGLDILSKEAQTKLLSAKERYFTHLNKEDRQLYPVLIKEAKDNKLLEGTLVLLAIDMMDVSRVVLEFFDKYSSGVLGKELQGEFESLFVALRKRIKNEEDILYKEYDKINQQ